MLWGATVALNFIREVIDLSEVSSADNISVHGFQKVLIKESQILHDEVLFHIDRDETDGLGFLNRGLASLNPMLFAAAPFVFEEMEELEHTNQLNANKSKLSVKVRQCPQQCGLTNVILDTILPHHANWFSCS